MSTEAHSATSAPALAGSDTAALIAGAGIVLARQGVPVPRLLRLRR